MGTWKKKSKFFLEKGAHFAFYGSMASVDAKSITRLAIPATYWSDKDLLKEPWFDIRQKIYYEAKVLEHKQDWKKSKLIFKGTLLEADEVEWLTEEDVLNFDFEKKPSDAILASEYKDESETDEDEDVIISHAKKRKTSKATRGKATAGVW